MAQKIRVAILDDHQSIIDGSRSLYQPQHIYCMIGKAANAIKIGEYLLACFTDGFLFATVAARGTGGHMSRRCPAPAL